MDYVSKFPDWVHTWKPDDQSGNPERFAWLHSLLPSVNLKELTEAVPHVLFWSEEEILSKVNFLKENLEGYDIERIISDSPTLLNDVDKLRGVFAKIKELCPGRRIRDMFPLGPFSNENPLRQWGNEWREPYSSLVRGPYADPGLMNYEMSEFEFNAIKSFPAFGSYAKDRKAMVRFKDALERSILAFEVRVTFLREHYGEEQFQRYHADGLYEDVVGEIDDWCTTHPGYEPYLEEKLNGYDGKDMIHYRTLSAIEKESTYLTAYNNGWGRIIDTQLADDEDLDDDEIAAKQSGMDKRLEEFTEEEIERMDAEQEELLQRAWQFELRTGYIKEQMDDNTFKTSVGRDINTLAFAHIDEFLKRYPGYDAWLSTHLDGVDDMDIEEWNEIVPDYKEELMMEMMDDYGTTMYQRLAEEAKGPHPTEAVFTEEGQMKIWGPDSA